MGRRLPLIVSLLLGLELRRARLQPLALHLAPPSAVLLFLNRV